MGKKNEHRKTSVITHDQPGKTPETRFIRAIINELFRHFR
jgi:hypothetical protein